MCEWCGKVLEHMELTQRFCSSSHRKSARLYRRRQEFLATLPCAGKSRYSDIEEAAKHLWGPVRGVYRCPEHGCGALHLTKKWNGTNIVLVRRVA